MNSANAKGPWLTRLVTCFMIGSLMVTAGCSSTGLAAAKADDKSAGTTEQNVTNGQSAPAVVMEKEDLPALVAVESKNGKKQALSESVLADESFVPNAGAGTTGESVPDTGKDAGREPVSRSAGQQTNPATRQPVVKYLSADDSNSCASPVIARKLINSGKYVQPALIRTYEFLNYYHFSYPAPQDKPVAILAVMRERDEPGKYSLQVAVRSRNKRPGDLPPMNITFLIDVSGSMAGEPLELARQFVGDFSAKMRPQDMLSIVICNRKSRIVLDSCHCDSLLADVLAKNVYPFFIPNDITNLDEGIATAYKLAGKNYQPSFLNRVILISDGAANAGTTAPELVGKYAGDSEKQGIYLAGLGVGEGFNDDLMNAFTDKGRGAYLFLDSKEEVANVLQDDNFTANFDLAVKDVRLKMVIPPYWYLEEFHGEQIASQASEVVPQYLAPNDQMIYHMVIAAETDAKQKVLAVAGEQNFEFEVEYRPLGGKPEKEKLLIKVADMLKEQTPVLKGDAIVAYAEFLKKVKYPLVTEPNKSENLKEYSNCVGQITALNEIPGDSELIGLLALLKKYERTLKFGEQFMLCEDRDSNEPAAILGISPNSVVGVNIKGGNPAQAVKALNRLRDSKRLVPLEGYKFLALGSGPVGNPTPSRNGDLGAGKDADPLPEYIGYRKTNPGRQQVFDLHQIAFTLKAPGNAKSFSFDFNFFSAEYPGYIKKNFNDTFYAILKAASTNDGKTTNIAFDPDNNSMEVDNNYFQNPFHPIPNTGTGFDQHGSTGWLRTSWPIRGGETFTLTFSIHDEGDAVYDSLVLLDNFQWHTYEAVGTTDPLN